MDDGMLTRFRMASGDCRSCKELLERTCRTIERDLKAVAQLQDAVLRGDVDLSAALEIVVRDARAERMAAFEEYRQHLKTHATPSLSRTV